MSMTRIRRNATWNLIALAGTIGLAAGCQDNPDTPDFEGFGNIVGTPYEPGDGEPGAPVQRLRAEAGKGQIAFGGEVVLLDGTQSVALDPESVIYRWQQKASDLKVDIQDRHEPMARFVAPQVDDPITLQFTLTLIEGQTESNDTVAILIRSSADGGAAPAAFAGRDRVVASGDIVALVGSGLRGSESKVLSFKWEQLSGPEVEFETANNEAAIIFAAPDVDDGPTELVFELTIVEGGVTATDTVSVFVYPSTDRDGDGYLDFVDGCPDDPLKFAPGYCGCGVADVDTDGDGVLDCLDACPQDPAKVHPGFCGCGSQEVAAGDNGLRACPDPCGGGPDTDGDGTPDCLDACPNDPNKTVPGACGCGVADTDTDGDGTPDCNDLCPDDPLKTTPGPCGCGVPDTDTDGDGVRDCNDACELDPNKIVPGICGCGTADTDTDGDGTPNCIDGCPSDPNKTSPGVCGCGQPDLDLNGDGTVDCMGSSPASPCDNSLDSDGDGVPDCSDGCPFDPNKTSPGVCGCGETDNDSDGDGIHDCNDVCPGVPDVDNNGDGVPDCLDSPSLCVSTTALNFGSSSSSQAFEVWNCGSGSLSYTLTDSASWLSLSPTSGSSSGERDLISATVNRSGLTAGTYQATITVTGGGQTVILSANMMVPAPSGGGGGGSSGALASRTSGVAPLLVVFDATVSSVTQPPGGDYALQNYIWDFGDPGSGSWTNNGKSRNQATGYITAHVFQNPGTYNVTLTVIRSDGSAVNYQEQISVQDFSGTTYYVSSAGSDSNNGTTQSTPFRTVGRAATVAGPNVRILFRRGDTFAASDEWVIDRSGPCIVGAYGSGAIPVIQWPSGYTRSGVVFSANSQGNDWRFMDIHLRGPGAGAAFGMLQNGKMMNNLFLGCRFTQWHYGVAMTEVSSSLLSNMNGFVECEFYGNAVRSGWFGGQRLAMLGNRMLTLEGGSTQVRCFHLYKSVLGHNVLGGGGPLSSSDTFKCHGQAALPPVQYVIISDNDFKNQDGGAWPCEIAPQAGDSFANEPIYDVVVERNIFRGNGTTQVALIVSASSITIRNNIFIATGTSPWYDAITVFRRSVPAAPTNVRIYNNTVARTDSGLNISVCNIFPEVSNARVMNNLVYAPQTATRFILEGGGTGLWYDPAANLIANQQVFVNGSLSAPADFRLLSGTSATSAGIKLDAVFDDFWLNPRPASSPWHLGAIH